MSERNSNKEIEDSSVSPTSINNNNNYDENSNFNDSNNINKFWVKYLNKSQSELIQKLNDRIDNLENISNNNHRDTDTYKN